MKVHRLSEVDFKIKMKNCHGERKFCFCFSHKRFLDFLFALQIYHNFFLLSFLHYSSEDLILFNPVVSPTIKEFSIAKLVTNGIVSQFLGNLVTFNTWNDAWIFKGISKFLEYHLNGANFASNELFISEVLHPTLRQQFFASEFPFSVDTALGNESAEKGKKLLFESKKTFNVTGLM